LTVIYVLRVTVVPNRSASSVWLWRGRRAFGYRRG